MAKKKKPKSMAEGDLASEVILDSLADDGDESAQAQGASGSDDSVVPTSKTAHGRILRAEFLAWPCEPDHGSATAVLTGAGAGSANDIVLDEEDDVKKGGAMNFVLLLLIAGAAIAGGWQLGVVSSPETLAAKKAEKAAIEQAYLEEQMAKQKKYGVLRIESNPPQADVSKDAEKLTLKNEATGEEVVVRTPANLMDLDIAQSYKIRIEKEGYESFDFFVAEHLWTKDSGSGEYKFFKAVELTPNLCEYYFLYDAKKKRELKFDDKATCLEHFEGAMAKGTSVTDCTCKIPPEGWEPPVKKDDKKGAKKGK
jgi:hypothetical protein